MEPGGVVEGGKLLVRIGCEFEYESASPVPMAMLVRPPPSGAHRTLYESRWTNPDVPVREYLDMFGNACWRLVAPGGPLTIRYDAVVEIPRTPDPVHSDLPLTPVEKVPDDTLIYTLPSRYVESDLLGDAAWQLFADTPPTWARVQAICDWVHTQIRFETGASTTATTAMHVYESRTGVCRDFALLAVAFCRALNIPARYGFGYLPDVDVEPPDVPMDFHSWFEAYLGGAWYLFDARHNTPRIGRVIVGRGRDAVDVALSTSYGSTTLTRFSVWADEVQADEAAALAQEADADALEAADPAPGAQPPSGVLQG